MKKFTSFMLMLLCAVTTWGQNVVTSTAESPVYYTITSYSRGGVISYESVGSNIKHIDYDATGKSSWYFEAVEGDENNGVRIVNKLTDGENKIYLGSDQTASTTAATWYIISNGVNEQGYSISATSTVSSGSCLDAQNNNVGRWAPLSSDWEGTTWCFMGDFTNETYNPSAFTAQQGTGGRNITAITINSVIKNTRSAGFAFADYTRSHEYSVLPGEDIAISITKNGNWMNAYVYIDFDGKGFATEGVAENGYTPTGDLVSYSAYNADPNNGGTWYKSDGTTLSDGNTVELPGFTAPATTGKYRLRVKYDWNDLDPNGGSQFTTAGSQFIDITLNVVNEIVEPEYITNAKAILTEAGMEAIALQVDNQDAAGYIWANTYAAGEEGVIDYLVDGNNNTYFHTSWSSYATDGTKDYLEVDLGANNSIKNLVFDYVTRHNGQTDFPTSVTIKGSNDKNVYEDIATISEGLPSGNTRTYASEVLTNGKEYRYIRFQVNSTTRNNATIPYFHLAEINFYKVTDNFSNDYITELTGINRAIKNPTVTETSVAAAIESYNMAPYPNTLAGFTNTKCYTVTTKNRGGWAVDTEGNFVAYNQAGEIDEDYKKFAVLTPDNENYYLFNIGAKKFVKYDCTTVEGVGTSIAIADASAQGAKRIRVNFNATDAYININGEGNMDVCYWSAIDEGNAVLFTPAGDFDSTAALEMLTSDAAALEELIAEIEGLNITSGTKIGEYTEASVANLTEALNTAKGLTEVTADDVEALQAAYDALAVNLPAVGALIAFQSVSTKEYCAGKYVKTVPVVTNYSGGGYSADRDHTQLVFDTCEPATTPSAVFQVVAGDNEGEFKLKNMHTQEYVVSFVKGAQHMGTEANAVAITLKPISEGQIAVFGANNAMPMHAQEANNVIVTWTAETNNASAWEVLDVETFAHVLTMSEVGYSTLKLGFDATIPEGVECYYATEAIDENGVLNLEQITGILPANTAVIVKLAEGYEAGDYNFTYSETAGTAIENNKLAGSVYDETITSAGTAYVLSAPDNNVGLYKATLTDGTFKNNANKAYFDVSSSNSIAYYSFNFNWGGTTGIDGVEAEAAQNGKIYDITGREVKAITAPGIYIVNGKKVIK